MPQRIRPVWSGTAPGTGPLDALLTEIGDVPDELDGLSLVNARREADFKVKQAINALKVLRKLSA